MADSRIVEPTQVGPWKIGRKIGAGGFGAVYMASHRDRPEIRRALKWLLTPDADALARLRREAELLARLQHPGIVRVYEVGDHDKGAYIVMDLVSGRGLRDVVVEAPNGLPLERAFELAHGIGEAMSAAHAEGITHRDLKPENVLVDENGQPRIIDFGLALASDVERLTKSGTSMGTLSYMPPEQLDGRRAEQGTWTDVYALGAIFYELVTGKQTFSGAEGNLVFKVASGKYEPASKLRADLPEGTDAFVAQCLDARPNKRLPDGRAFVDALDALCSGALAKSEKQAGRRRALSIAAGLAITFAGLGGAGLYTVKLGAEEASVRRAHQEELKKLDDDVRALSLETVTADQVAGTVARLDPLRAFFESRKRNAQDREDARQVAAVEARVSTLLRVAKLRSSNAGEATDAAKSLLAETPDAAIRALAWTKLAQHLPDKPAERRAALDSLLAQTASPSSSLRRLVAREELAIASGLDDAHARELLGHVREVSRIEYEEEAAVWAREAIAFLSPERLDQSWKFALALRDKFPPKGDDDKRAALVAAMVELAYAHASACRDSAPANAIADRAWAYENAPEIPAPPWYVGWLEKIAFGEEVPGDIRSRAFLELVAEDGTWGITSQWHTRLTMQDLFQLPLASEQHLLRVCKVFAAARYPHLVGIRVAEELPHPDELPARYRDLARSLARRHGRGIAKGDLLPSESLAPVPHAFALVSRIVGDVYLPMFDANGTLTATPDHLLEAFATEESLYDKAEELERQEIERLKAAVEKAPDDPYVARSLAIAWQRRGGILEGRAAFAVEPLHGIGGDTAGTFAAVLRRAVAKLDEAIEAHHTGNAPTFRFIAIESDAMEFLPAAKALARADRLYASDEARKTDADMRADAIASEELCKVHFSAAQAALRLLPPDFDRAERESKACHKIFDAEATPAQETAWERKLLDQFDEALQRRRREGR